MPELKDSDKLRQQILEEARSRIPTPPSEDEITARGLAESEGCTSAQARLILADMVEDGVATVRDNGVENGKACKVYKYLVREQNN